MKIGCLMKFEAQETIGFAGIKSKNKTTHPQLIQ